MKIFLDTASVADIKTANDILTLDGVTTNPTLIMKEGKDYVKTLKEITEIVNGPISAETVSLDADGMVKEGKEFAKLHKNIVVKVPLIKEGLKAVKTLSEENIRVNVTLCFSPAQALLAAKAGATYISPFIGRLDDISTSGMDLISQIVQIYRNYNFNTEVLVASVRHPLHLVEAALIGADICTMPFGVIDKLFNHPLTDIGLRKFLADWDKLSSKEKK